MTDASLFHPTPYQYISGTVLLNTRSEGVIPHPTQTPDFEYSKCMGRKAVSFSQKLDFTDSCDGPLILGGVSGAEGGLTKTRRTIAKELKVSTYKLMD